MFISNAMPGDPSYWVGSENFTEGTPLIGSVPKIAQCSSVTLDSNCPFAQAKPLIDDNVTNDDYYTMY